MVSSKQGEQDAIRYLWSIGFLGPIVFWIVVVILGLLDPAHNFVSDSISSLGRHSARYPEILRVNMGILGVSIGAFAGGLALRFRNGWRSLIGITLVAVGGVGAVLSGIFPSSPDPLVEMGHLIGGLMFFLGAAIAIPIMSWHFYLDDRYPGYHSRWTVVAVTILTVGTLAIFFYNNFALGAETGYDGITQLPNVLVMTGWAAYSSFTLYRREKME